MNATLIIANVLVLLTFLVHTFGGDRAYRKIEPKAGDAAAQQHWTMGRGAFHMVSADFILATLSLTLINFSSFFSDPRLLLHILALYFFAYGLSFLITLICSRKFKGSFIRLWQWLLMFVIAGLIYSGTE